MGLHSKVCNLFLHTTKQIWVFFVTLQLSDSNNCELIDLVGSFLMCLLFINYTLRFQEILLLPSTQTPILCCKI